MSVHFGIDIGGTQVKTALVDEDGHLLSRTSVDTLVEQGFEDLCRRLYDVFSSDLKHAGISEQQVAGLGIGVPGFVDSERGYVYEAVNLGWKNLDLALQFEKVFTLPASVENDANLAALGEAWVGGGRGKRSVICATVGTGIGAGIVLNGRLYSGVNGMAGEIGHLPVVREGGRHCNCGHDGCLETVASATAIVRDARAALPHEADSIHEAKDVFALARDGVEEARQVVRETAEWLGYGLAMVGNTLNPDSIVIGGGVSKAGDVFLKPVIESFRKYALDRVVRAVDIKAALLGNDAGVVGAARLAAQRHEW